MYDKVIQNHKNDTIAEKYIYIFTYLDENRYPLSQKIWQPIPMNTKNCNGYITTDDLREILTELDPELSRFYIIFQFVIGSHEARSWSICSWSDLRWIASTCNSKLWISVSCSSGRRWTASWTRWTRTRAALSTSTSSSPWWLDDVLPQVATFQAK